MHRIATRRVVVTMAVAWFILFVLVILSFQYANYVDRNSNHRWCGIVNLFNDTYSETPPSTLYGTKLAEEMLVLQKEFGCE